jgi:hypothetical protein
MDSKGVRLHGDYDFRGIQEAQRESQSISGIQTSSPYRRKTSSKIVGKVSWVEEAKQDVQRKEVSRRRVSSRMGSWQTIGFSSVIEGVSNHVD